MTFFRSLRIVLTLAVLAGMMSASGCGGTSLRDAREERDPLLRRAREKRNAQDMEGAVELYQRALDKKPNLARAHLELGALFDQNQRDYVRAIYHYERYLEMQPEAEKKELVQELIRHARLSFAASLPDRPNEAVREIAKLKQEISALHDELARVQGSPRPAPAPAATRSSAANAPAPTPTPVPTASNVAAPVVMETYVVVAGDTLSRVAGKVYGDSKRWPEIYEANRAILPSPQSMRVGQTLQIPKKSSR